MYRVAYFVAATVVLAGLALAGISMWTPPAHPVHTPGATPVDAHFAPGWVLARGGQLAPSTSLDEVRCEVWKTMSAKPCPDSTRLAQQFWPNLTQSPRTLYVPLSSDVYPGAVNVEYDHGEAAVLIHSYESRPLWVPYQRPDVFPGARAQPTIPLLMVSTTGIEAGAITISQDSWIERVTGDETNRVFLLGTVAIA